MIAKTGATVMVCVLLMCAQIFADYNQYEPSGESWRAYDGNAFAERTFDREAFPPSTNAPWPAVDTDAKRPRPLMATAIAPPQDAHIPHWLRTAVDQPQSVQFSNTLGVGM
jgi:hypothetical protein